MHELCNQENGCLMSSCCIGITVQKFLYVCVCVCMQMYVCGYICLHIHVQMETRGQPEESFILFFKTGSLIDVGLVMLGWLGSLRDPLVPASPALGLCTTIPACLCEFWRLNSVPHVCITSTLPTKLSPEP